ncbi:MAG: hypothetical protein A2487_01200 [Candidatus Raymondbacteria bacterium RifOxyC12_full_50_8]|uniref:SynChlorMet cassette protein ScmC n=1 Tax=Candidatus Raymondbacteria bacterium RIFOXYD12_FULL_49_13 TaxID=1817890 RepID=A0A1F7F967_UNCRA|nr:MAG: hypothetical protein A2248_09730 [Candidatus Raymondbacteria bacterium RIFOXYA2_FULL_49_16]OGJ95499.1 MAG: hypothetical protein A2487_01200 [Candidatus Raymondbacteria bacterium RifOxyC12_full_50_8]OGJ97183.1 MAG: hypothetical protein A2453_10375 [Candidatus Raymondbacteria bacterium RIFOXYC2_FULL_50_21]OGK03210.1 MAG: hypothetical protein A2519_05125 [Candidatus Raymondbacteria bacterium RIFOXYD12_FULL_49_13]OGP42914.1 MAG: hypothetical protein A2324_02885 [Candidatus Raymondbacteria b
MIKQNIEIASVVISIICDNKTLGEKLFSQYKDFFSRKKAVLDFCINSKSRCQFLNRPSGICLRRHGKNVFLSSRGFDLKICFAPLKALINFNGDLKIFDQALRLLYSQVLPIFNGLLVHGAAIADDKGAYLFYGPSEAGKTTVSKMAERVDKTVLTDELAAIRKIKGQYYLFGTPFWGHCNGPRRNMGKKLISVLRLVKSNRFGVVEAKPIALASSLLQSIMNFENNSGTNQRLLNAASDLVAMVPTKEIEFRKTDNIWRKIA